MNLNKKDEKSENTDKSVFSQIFLDKEARLSKKSWHYQLLKFVLGEKIIPQNNFCPYFWLTIFAFFVAIVIVPIKLFFLTLKSIWEFSVKAFHFLHDGITNILGSWYARTLEKDPDSLFVGFIFWNSYWSYNEETFTNQNGLKHLMTDEEYSLNVLRRYTFSERFNKWKESTPDWQEKIEQWKKEREASLEKREQYFRELAEKRKIALKKRAEKEEKNHKRMIKIRNNMIKAGKWFGAIFLVPFVLVVLYYTFNLLVFLYTAISKTSWEDWVRALKATGIAIGIILLFLLLVTAIRALILYIRDNVGSFNISIPSPVKKGFGYLLAPIAYVFKGIWEGIEFFVIFFKNWKSDNCPGIIWEEDEKIK